MPFIDVNGANIYYETFGVETPGKAPIILIHGSTGTGRSNWRYVAPLLAREYWVIVPDCRGHGKSNNPYLTYSFKEMADDTAALVHLLGYERAHIIGHSNGGNVALVTLMEHPEVVQTAVPQAANAYVSPDLPAKEPPIFDPDRVEREDPEWMKEMIALHGEANGPNYWRDLLTLTVNELIKEPNYTPSDLGQVRRPTLVIQGASDRVNAPFKHAEFIARFIPDAELWVPGGIGHNVHDEILFKWIEKILDFLRRRGNDANDAIYRLGHRLYQDKRDWVYDIKAESRKDNQDGLKISGQVLVEEQRQAVLGLFPGKEVQDEIRVLIDEKAAWFLVKHPVTDLRREPSRASERVSQALLGETGRILEENSEWAKVRLDHDGYIGWIRLRGLQACSKADVDRYQNACTHLVAADILPAYPSAGSKEVTGRLPFGVSLPLVENRNGMALVRLPDESCVWVSFGSLLPLSDRPHPDVEGIQRTLAYLRSFIGVPYLWGGRTPFGFDCSGMAQAFLRFMGLNPRRDASQQFMHGTPIEGDFKPGDLLFFGDIDEGSQIPGVAELPRRPISHVAISLGGDEVIHASGGPDRVTYNSLDPDSPIYYPWLKENLAGARRYV